MTRRWTLIAALSALVFVATAVLVGQQILASGSPGTDPHGTALPETRLVQLSFSMPTPSGFDGLHAKLVRGAMPRATTEATVLTDEQCQPDARGVSHCLNRLRLSDGTQIEVRHPHDMSDVACLSPGEHVRLAPSLDA